MVVKKINYMQSLCVTTISNNKKSLKKLTLFNKKTNINQKFKITTKKCQKKTRKKIFAVLASPHVNKKAQEQFEYKTFSAKHTFYSYNMYSFMIYLKRALNNVLSDVTLKLELNNSSTNINPNFLKPFFNIKYFSFNIPIISKSQKVLYKKIEKKVKRYKRKKQNKLSRKLKFYLKPFNLYGKITIV